MRRKTIKSKGLGPINSSLPINTTISEQLGLASNAAGLMQTENTADMDGPKEIVSSRSR